MWLIVILMTLFVVIERALGNKSPGEISPKWDFGEKVVSLGRFTSQAAA